MKVEDVVKIGDKLDVKVTEIDDKGRINVSYSVLMEPEAGGGNGGGAPRGGSGGNRPPRSSGGSNSFSDRLADKYIEMNAASDAAAIGDGNNREAYSNGDDRQVP